MNKDKKSSISEEKELFACAVGKSKKQYERLCVLALIVISSTYIYIGNQ